MREHRRLEVAIEFEADAEAPRGRLCSGGGSWPFCGWLGLAVALERALAAAEPGVAASRPEGLAACPPEGVAASRPEGLAACPPKGVAASPPLGARRAPGSERG